MIQVWQGGRRATDVKVDVIILINAPETEKDSRNQSCLIVGTVECMPYLHFVTHRPGTGKREAGYTFFAAASAVS